ncbi:MAG: hypothetical protein JSS66_00695 [Armatimonadetes bacterium]|nr:hypothetical protein [Armatimonadota bacterium]
MNRSTRALFGAIVGALIVLFAHPSSRPYLIAGWPWRPPGNVDRVIENGEARKSTLPSPLSAGDAAVWLQTAAEIDLAGKLTLDQALLSAELARQGSSNEPDNAFWLQMESVYLFGALRGTSPARTPSMKAWMEASRRTTWNDHQSERLNMDVRQMDGADYAPFSWHRSLAMVQRSDATARRILIHSRALLSPNPSSLDLRVASVRNGSLLRDGSKSLGQALAGARLVDLSAFGDAKGPLSLATPRAGQEARGQLLKDLADNPEERRAIAVALAENDAWYAFQPTAEFVQMRVDRARQGLAACVIPGVLLAIGIMGALVVALGMALEKSGLPTREAKPVFFYVMALVAGLATYAGSRMVFPTLWIFIATLSFAVSQERRRTGTVSDLGYVFKGIQLVLAVTIGISSALYLSGISSQAQWLAEAAALPSANDPLAQVPLHFSLLGLSVVVATAPAWGLLYRFSPLAVLPVAFKQFGGFVATGALSLAVLATPLCLSYDRRLSEETTQMLVNEPNHYLSQAH